VTHLEIAVLVFVAVTALGTFVVRYSQLDRDSDFINRRPKPWPESVRDGAMLGVLAALVYAIGAVADCSKLFR
jgi:hypothetical protein